jgi:hypothetical protein
VRPEQHQSPLADDPLGGEVPRLAVELDRASDAVLTREQLLARVFRQERRGTCERDRLDPPVLLFEERAHVGEMGERRDRRALAPRDQVGLVGDVVQRGFVDRAAGEHEPDRERESHREHDDQRDRLEQARPQRVAEKPHAAVSL